MIFFHSLTHKITGIIPQFPFSRFCNLFGYFIEKNLTGKTPNLFLFDLYKPGYFAGLRKNQANH
jgi:hypothetical protein